MFRYFYSTGETHFKGTYTVVKMDQLRNTRLEITEREVAIMKYFWTNTIWYILLGITILIEIAYIMKKAENRRRLFALYLTISGATYGLEVTIFGFFKSYDYFPMIFHNISRLDDGLAGNIFSQFSVSATALMISFLNLKYYWYIIIALIYGGIEELFLYLGIYKQNWYQTWMTVAGLILFFPLVKAVYKKTFNSPGRLFKYMLIYFAVYVPHVLLITWPFKLLGYPAFNDKILPDPVTSVMLIFSISFTSLANIIMITYFLKPKWWWHAVVILFLYTAYYFAYIFNYIIYKEMSMLLLFATAEIFGMYLCVFIIDRLYGSICPDERG